MRNVVFVLSFLAVLATAGCSGPQVSGEDVMWPADVETAKQRISLPKHWEKAPYLPPVNDIMVPPFRENKDLSIKTYNSNGVPQFNYKEHRGFLVWYLTHRNPETGNVNLDEIQVYSYPEGAMDSMRRGSLPAEEFAWSVFLKNDGTWQRLNYEQLVRRHDRWHMPHLATMPLIRRIAGASPTYEQALPIIQPEAPEPMAQKP